MTTRSTPVPATEGQIKEMRRLVEEAAEKAAEQLGLDKTAMRRLIELGVAGLMPRLVTLFTNLVITDEFADEETQSEHGYLSGYKPRPVADQMVALKSLFPQLESFDESVAAEELKPGSEGKFLIPRWQKLAATYSDAVELVLAKLNEQREGEFYNYRHREGELISDCLRQSARKEKFFQVLGDEQSGHDVLVFDGQFGLCYRGKSVRRARVVMRGNECGLGVFEVGIMLLTHPERLANYDDLHIDCAGDEYAPEADGNFYEAPCFSVWENGDLEFSANEVAHACDQYGSASAFVRSIATFE